MVIPSLSGERNASDNPWIVFDYEVQMYFETRNLSKYLRSQKPKGLVIAITKNSVLESLILHTRILTDILISNGSRGDDIMLKDLLPEWCNSEVGKTLVEKLEVAYGKPSEEGTPRWIINKMLAHPTKWRTDRFDYSRSLRQIEPPIFAILSEIEAIVNRPMLSYYVKGVRSRDN